MQCPRTGKAMKTIQCGGVTAEVSEGCGGVWFDRWELNKFDEPSESAGEDIIQLMEQFRDDSVNQDGQILCPRCGDTVLMRHFFSIKRQVTIDECAQCGGIWLDAGELAQVRQQYSTKEERDKAANAMIGGLFGSPEMDQLKQKDDGVEKARRYAQMFKMVYPSAEDAGDQNWSNDVQ